MRTQGSPSLRPARAHACWFVCWAALFLGVLTAASALSAPAQNTSTKQDARKRTSKKALRSRVQRGKSVQGYIIQGDEVIAIIREVTFDPTVEVTIVNSVIEGELDFTALPAAALPGRKMAKVPVRWPSMRAPPSFKG